MSQSSRPVVLTRRHLLLGAASLGASGLLAACGGGGGDAPGASANETAASFTTGPITGFGSVIVGGVRFDDSFASFVDEDGNSRSRGELKLGCIVDVDGSSINRAELRARALRIALGGALVGPVNAVDLVAKTITLLGQTVLITTSTVFDDSLAGGLSVDMVGDVLEVHGLYDAVNKRFVATRVEPKSSATEYRLRGEVSAVDTTAKTFKIGSEVISYAGVPAADLRTPPVNGQFLRVRMQTTPVNGVWIATRMGLGVRSLESRSEAHVEGIITVINSATEFEINGLKVDTSRASFPDGTAGIVVGARVEAEGAIVNGVLVASKVEIEDRRSSGEKSLEFHGTMSNLDTTAKTFALRGLTIWYGGTVEYRDGSAASLANGREVEVRGVIAADRTRVEARRIEFK